MEVEKIINGGYGLARINGIVYLIPYAVPGDVLNVECFEGTNPIFCRIKRLVKPSTQRIEPICPNFGTCGGCDFQNMSYEYELEVKRKIVREDLMRIAKIEIGRIRVISSYPDYYRNNVQFKTDGDGNIGFFRKKSNEIVPIPYGLKSSGLKGCILIDRRINDFILNIREKVNFKKGGFRVRCNRNGYIYKKGIPGTEDDKYCDYEALDIKYRIGIDDFFQVNNYLYEEWLKLVIDYISPDSNDIIADLFSGSGFVALSVAKKVKKVFGMEVNGSAVKNAKYSSFINGIDNVIFKRMDVNKGFYLEDKLTKIVVDPPRSGMSRLLIDELVKYNPDTIVYVSCNTATFSRDVRLLYQKGYTISNLSMIDLFPRTAHIETIVKLIRK